jgi:hypothetical protein
VKDSRRIRTGALLGALVILTLLAGCAASSNGSTDTEPTEPAPASSTAAPDRPAGDTEEPAAGQDVESGTILDSKPADLPAGLSAYALPDGTYVAVAKDAPLPDAVAVDAQSQMGTRIADVGTLGVSPTNPATVVDSAQEYASLLGLQTGKKVVIVFPMIGACLGESEDYVGYASTRVGPDDRSVYPCALARTIEEAQARANDLVNRQTDPSAFQVLVHQG